MFRHGPAKFLTLLEIICDTASIYSAFYLATHILNIKLPEGNQFPLLMGTLILIVFAANKLYGKHKTILNIEETRLILKSLIISVLIIFSLLFLSEDIRNPEALKGFNLISNIQAQIYHLGLNQDVSRLGVILAFTLMFPIISLLRYIIFKIGQSLHRKGIGNDRVLVYGKEELARHLCEKIKRSPKSGYYLVDLINNFDDLENICKEKNIHRLIVADSNINPDQLVEVLRLAQEIKIELEFVPAMHTLFIHKIRLRDIDGLPLISVPNRNPSILKQLSKQLFDKVGGFLLLILFSPLLLFIALCLKIFGKGPVLFVQERSGLNGKLFNVIKFRTMNVNAEKYAPTPESPNDARITSIGRWLRRFSLDELPQLFNVLKGEMSLVGPRPEMAFITEKYSTLEKERLRIKPGMTGLWQISADREQQIHENLDYDLYYIEHQSFLLDLVILMRTLFSMIRGVGSY